MTKINKGSLWLGKTWKEAIELSLKTSDCGVEPVFKYKHPNKLLNTEKMIIGYQLTSHDNHRKYTTRVPKSLNDFCKEVIL